MRIAIATFSGMPDEFRDDELLVELLEARGHQVVYEPWDSADLDWDGFDLVHARSPWDYSGRAEEFLAWTRSVGDRLQNSPELIAWNSDKHYLADLAAAGIPVVETHYVRPGEPPPEIDREVVIKPTISAGARDTGRFSPASAAQGSALLERITGSGGVAMVQPFLDTVESSGETAVVTFAGRFSHALHKRAVLGADEVAPARDDALGVAEVMYAPDLVVAGSADTEQLEFAELVLDHLRERFGEAPLVARIDMLRDSSGVPVLLELEAIEPNLYFQHAPGAAERLVDAILAHAGTSKRT